MDQDNGTDIHFVHINVETTAVTTFLGLVTIIVGLLCNLCVILTIARTRSLQTSSINRAVFSLCLADLLTVLIDCPLTMVILIGNHYEFMPWSDSALCSVQSFAHTIANSIQVMAFPVIGLERFFSIKNPFDKQRHLKRVTILNVIVWIVGIIFAILTVFAFPTTTVSLYCNVTPLQKQEVKNLFHKIYYLTFPLGMICVLITVICYGLIVVRVRKQNITSLASNPSSAGNNGFVRNTRRTRSYSGPTFSAFSATFFNSSSNATLDQSSQASPEQEEDFAQVTRSSRRKSLPHAPQKAVAAPGRRRPVLKKEDAFDMGDDVIQMHKISSSSAATDVSVLTDGLKSRSVSVNSYASPRHLAPPAANGQVKPRSVSVASCTSSSNHLQPPPSESKTRSVSMTSAASSNASSLTSDFDRSVLSTACNSFDDDNITVFNDEPSEKGSPTTRAASNNSNEQLQEGITQSPASASKASQLAPRDLTKEYPFHHLNTPTIAITAAESNSQLHKDSIQVNLKAASRRRYSTMYLAPPMRRCKSAMASNDSLESRMSDNVPIVVHSADGLVKVYKSRRNVPSEIQDSKGAVCVRDKQAREMGRRRTEIKTAKRSSYIVLTFLCVWLPLPVAVAVSNFYVDRHIFLTHLQWHLDMQLGAFCVGWLVTITNPIIYGLAIRTFWTAFHKIVVNDWKSLKHCCLGCGCSFCSTSH